MRRLIKLVVITGVVVVCLLLSKNVLAKALVTGGVRAMTGLSLHMERLEVGLFKSALRVQGLRLDNPDGFPERTMVDMPELYVDYNAAALLTGRVHLEEVRLDLKELVVLRDQQGALNLNALKPVQSAKRSKADGSPKGPAKPDSGLRVDALQLRVGRVVFRDYSKGSPPQVKEFPVNLDERYQHITSPNALAGLILTKALARTTIASLANFDLEALQSQLSGTFQQATALVGRSAEAVKQLQQHSGEALKTTQEAVQGARDTLKKLLPGE